MAARAASIDSCRGGAAGAGAVNFGGTGVGVPPVLTGAVDPLACLGAVPLFLMASIFSAIVGSG